MKSSILVALVAFTATVVAAPTPDRRRAAEADPLYQSADLKRDAEPEPYLKDGARPWRREPEADPKID